MPLDRSRGLMRLVGLGKWMPTRNAIRSSQTPLQGGGSCLNGVFEIVCLNATLVRTGFVRRVGGMDGMAVRMWMRLGDVDAPGCTQSCRACQGWVAFGLALLVHTSCHTTWPASSLWFWVLEDPYGGHRYLPLDARFGRRQCLDIRPLVVHNTSHDFPSSFLILFFPGLFWFSWLFLF